MINLYGVETPIGVRMLLRDKRDDSERATSLGFLRRSERYSR